MTMLGNNGQESTRFYFDTLTREGIRRESAWINGNYPLLAEHSSQEVTYSRRCSYMTDFAAFDIETYSKRAKDPYAWMYHWQLCINGDLVFGRRWEEFERLMAAISNHYHLSDRRRFVIYVHNLSYEYQFIKRFFGWKEVFLKKQRVVVKAVTDTGIEFRCSYIMSNESLGLMCANSMALHCKIDDKFAEEEGWLYDYEKYRTADTPVLPAEAAYYCNDVLGLYECIQERLKEDTLATIPLTSTGYVRRDVRNACSSAKHKRLIRRLSLNLETYTLCREAFRGGDTHARYTSAGTMLSEVDCYDIASSYPYVIMVEKYPMTPWKEMDAAKFPSLYKRGFALLFRLRLTDVKIKDIWDMPYIPHSKCRNVRNASCDNGRILTADSIEITVTDVDYRIICDCYSFVTQEISSLHASEKGYLPVGVRETTMKYFESKCRLKKVEGQEVNYAKSKNRLNGIAGMMETDPVRELWEIDEKSAHKVQQDTEELLGEYNAKWSTFLAYQWGVYITAYGRERLWKVRCMKKGAAAYNDTDSVYVPEEEGFAACVEEYNQMIRREAALAPIVPVVTVNGKKFEMGILEHDGHYRRFITWGSKRYAGEDLKGGMHVTVSGLAKQRGESYLREKGMEVFRPGMTIERCGNMTAYYNDDAVHYIEEDGCRMLTASNIAMFPSTYTLTLKGQYADLIGYLQSVEIE